MEKLQRSNLARILEIGSNSPTKIPELTNLCNDTSLWEAKYHLTEEMGSVFQFQRSIDRLQ